MTQVWFPEMGIRWLCAGSSYVGKYESEFKGGRHRLSIAMSSKPESKALGQVLHA